MSILYDPAEYGAELIAEVDVREPDYSFDIVAVFRDVATGRLFGAYDSGCSCPTPFEEFTRLADMEPVRSVADAEALLVQEFAPGPSVGDRQAFLAKVRAALKDNA